MGTRLELQHKLELLMGSRNVYFQPPETLKMKYPCIRYSLSQVDTKHADDLPWKHERAYNVILIDSNPDNEYVQKLLDFPKSKFGTHYRAENLNHYSFTIFY